MNHITNFPTRHFRSFESYSEQHSHTIHIFIPIDPLRKCIAKLLLARTTLPTYKNCEKNVFVFGKYYRTQFSGTQATFSIVWKSLSLTGHNKSANQILISAYTFDNTSRQIKIQRTNMHARFYSMVLWFTAPTILISNRRSTNQNCVLTKLWITFSDHLIQLEGKKCDCHSLSYSDIVIIFL